MNCEEYREAITADPSFDGGAGHVTECEACQAYRGEMLALDERIGRALALEVPEVSMPDLPDIDAGKVVSLADRRVSAPTWFAVAATVILVAFLGVRIVSNGIEYDSLADEVLAHVTHEPHSMRVSDDAVSDRALNRVVARRASGVDHAAGLITYAHTCVINGRKVPHLVIQGKRGPVMVLLMPEEKVDGAIPLEDEFNQGVILPVGDGSIAIVGGHDEDLESIEETLQNSVTWST